jgi:hypothetical protein
MGNKLVTRRDSSIGIATGYELGDRGSIPGRGKRLSIPERSDRLWGPPSLLSNGYQKFFPWGVKRQRREADHSPPSGAEIKNGAIPPLPHTPS